MAGKLKLGKKEFVKDKRDLKLVKYLPVKGVLPVVPDSFGHESVINDNAWGMCGNDTVGNCVLAGGDHETMLWTREGGNPADFSDKTAISDYSAVTGYDPDDPNTDQGTNVRDALNYRRKTGLVDIKGKRHMIGAYVGIDPSKIDEKGRPYELLNAAYIFSAVGIGIQFPDTAMEQFNKGEPWTIVKGAKIEGGHYVCVVGFDGTYIIVVTWGKLQKMSIDFFLKYCDEAWAILSQELLNSQGKSPEGFDLPTLQNDLTHITEAPDPTPSPTPTPTPTPKPVSCTKKISAIRQILNSKQPCSKKLAAIKVIVNSETKVKSVKKSGVVSKMETSSKNSSFLEKISCIFIRFLRKLISFFEGPVN